MILLMDYHWPGNIYELHNIIEKSALLSKTEIIEIDNNLIHTSVIEKKSPNIEHSDFKTLAENEKEYIISILNKLNWVIGGKNGAAEILDVPASTLRSKMKKLGINRLT